MATVPRTLALCVVEARPLVLAVSLLRFMTGVALALPVAMAPAPLTILRGAAAWVLSIFAVYLFNGIADVTEDRINGAGRPIARGDLHPREAGIVTAAAAFLALVAAVGLPLPMLLIIAANLALGYLYSGSPLRLKGSAGGTVAVLCLSGLLSYLGGFVVATAGASVPVPAALIAFAAAATGWMVLVGVPAKDLSDIAGDAAAGRRTFGVRVGERVSRCVMVAAAAGLCAAFGLAIQLLEVPLTGVFLAMVAGVAAVTVAGAFACAATTAGGPAGRRTRRRPYGAFMGTQHLVHLTALMSHI
ncbi:MULTISPECIES: UbiA family prenyltransferase [unclassified Nonomuraea]|uniref:UbiA family prenyltransferase n=1 Tax=unclassified Nonomuraea TaxID=2593643 RepID=UPI0035C023DC